MALSLLEIVTRAAQAEDGVGVDSQSGWSMTMRPSVSIGGLQQTVAGGSSGNLSGGDLISVEAIGEWHVEAPDEDEARLVDELKRKLELLPSFSIREFMDMVRPVIEKSMRKKRESGCFVPHLNQETTAGGGEEVRENGAVNSGSLSRESEEEQFSKMLRKGGVLLGRKLVAVLQRCCLGLRFWSAIKALLEKGLVSSNENPQLVSKLVEERQAVLLTLAAHNVQDLAPSDILAMLKFFLEESKASRRSFEVVRREQRAAALKSIERAAQVRDSLSSVSAALVRRNTDNSANGDNNQARKRNFLSEAVVMACVVDGFEAWEICLHELVSSGQDEAVLAAVIVELDTGEAVRLLQYLHKWLDHFSKRLTHTPFPESGHAKHRVPSMAQVLQWISVVLDGQYTKFVLCSDYFPELRELQGLVQSLVAVGMGCTPLAGVVEHIMSGCPLPTAPQGSEAASDYIIEFHDIS
ncbi:hypothetical protein BDL97_17G099000 [Sphagnum fallax]|nr:hypothetical protein BDL97_17G099000 [Sphagnum fallax]